MYIYIYIKKKIESGRWNPQYERETEVIRCCVTDGSTEQLSGKCVIVYRLKSDIDFETKHLHEVGFQYGCAKLFLYITMYSQSEFLNRKHIMHMQKLTQYLEVHLQPYQI